MTQEKEQKSPLPSSTSEGHQPKYPECIGWSEEDMKWLEGKVQEHLQPIAARHGRLLFSIVINAGQAEFLLTTLHANAGIREVKLMIRSLTTLMNWFSNETLRGHEIPHAKFLECKQDIERVMALKLGMVASGEQLSKGGIILNS